MATIRRRGSRWHVQVRRKDAPTITKSFLYRADAEQWARQTEADIDRGDISQVLGTLRALTLADLVVRYRDSVTVGKRGAFQERHRLNCLLRKPIAQEKLASLTSERFARYRDDRLKRVAPVTVRRELSILRHMFELARKEWGLPMKANPITEISLPPLPPARTRRLEDGEYERLLVASDKALNPYLTSIIELSIETGMRRGETLNVRKEHISFETGTLLIPLTKNGFSRTIPLTPKAISIFRHHVTEADGRIFPLTANALRQAWERTTKRARIANLHFHDLRHEAISRFFEIGLSVAEVALISGHRDYRMLARYTHLKPQTIVAKLRELGRCR